jgi:hypothetical protein
LVCRQTYEETRLLAIRSATISIVGRKDHAARAAGRVNPSFWKTHLHYVRVDALISAGALARLRQQLPGLKKLETITRRPEEARANSHLRYTHLRDLKIHEIILIMFGTSPDHIRSPLGYILGDREKASETASVDTVEQVARSLELDCTLLLAMDQLAVEGVVCYKICLNAKEKIMTIERDAEAVSAGADGQHVLDQEEFE